MMAEHLERLMISRGFTRSARRFSQIAQPAVKITSVLSDEKLIPIGVSKFGGTPHVPENFQWPIGSQGQPLSFIAQIDFAEFQPFQWMGWNVPVPKSGMISAFVDLRDDLEPAPDWSLQWFPETAALVRWEDPYALDSPAQRITACGQERVDLKAKRFPPSSVAYNQYLALPTTACEEIDEFAPEDQSRFTAFAIEHVQAGGNHQMLGWPWGPPIDDPTKELILQIGPDPLLGWSWNYVLQFFVPRQDLDECRFDAVVMRKVSLNR